jgi:hypothetical protein
MKKACSVALMTIFAALAYGQRIRTVDGDTAESASVRGEAIRISVMLQDSGRQTYREAALDEVFFDGQRFRLRVSAAREGYLYVLCGNSQGSAVVLFPNNSGADTNHVPENRPVTVPGKSWFQFDEEPGTERVYVLLADNPIAELDSASGGGGEISPDVIERYAQLDTGRNKGIIRTEDGDISVRRVDLRHESR